MTALVRKLNNKLR